MSRAYIVTRNGGVVTKAPINDNKIPIYVNKSAMEADLANIGENVICMANGFFYLVKTVGGVKTTTQLTDKGYGLPLGTIIAVYSNTVPDGFLPCNGTTYDTTTYSALYAYLGSNKLPDLRECVLVGAGQSDNEYDASTNPNGIHEHDVYAVGEFKDDQLQNIIGSFGGNQDVGTSGAFRADRYNVKNSGTDHYANVISFDASRVARAGETTHGKQMGVNYCIKATPAYVEPDTVSDMVNTLRTQDSYSTEEVNTGKKWIDGKPIYRKTYYSATNWSNGAVLDTNTDIETPITILATGKNQTMYITNPTSESHNFIAGFDTSTHQLIIIVNGVYANSSPAWVIFEYTKTTD